MDYDQNNDRLVGYRVLNNDQNNDRLVVVQGIIAEKGLDVKLSGGNVIPSLNGSI